MAGLITHLYVAELLINEGLLNISDRYKYFLGTLAPDAIMSKKDYHRDDKKHTHLRIGISSDDWYKKEYKNMFKIRVKAFSDNYIKEKNDDFAIGYLIHLLTDQAFHYTFRKSIIETLKEKKLPFEGRELMLSMVNELDSLDFYLLKKNKSLKDILVKCKGVCEENNIALLISSDSLCGNFKWIEEKYIDTSYTKIDFRHFNTNELSSLFEQVLEFIGNEIRNLSLL